MNESVNPDSVGIRYGLEADQRCGSDCELVPHHHGFRITTSPNGRIRITPEPDE